MITISHSYEHGTLLDGTTRADMPAIRDVLRTNAWKWSRTLGMWFQQSSRDQLPRMYRIDDTARNLRELGYQVTIDIDDTPRDMAEQEADRAGRLRDRVDALQAKASRRKAEADARREAADRVFDAIPMGQPMLVDHYSYPADRRLRERAWNNFSKSVQLGDQAQRAATAAEVAAEHMDHRNHPRAVMARVVALETELRQVDLRLSESDSARWSTIKADVENKLAYWRERHAENVAAGRIVAYGPDDVTVGDAVRSGGTWFEVVRVNKKTVTVNQFRGATGWITGTLPYHKITAVSAVKEQP